MQTIMVVAAQVSGSLVTPGPGHAPGPPGADLVLVSLDFQLVETCVKESEERSWILILFEV